MLEKSNTAKLILDIYLLLICIDYARSRREISAKLYKPDYCSHLMSDVGKKQNKLWIMEAQGQKRLCCGCNPGERLAEMCLEGHFNTTKCELCRPGTQIEEFAHATTKCRRIRVHPPRHYIIPKSIGDVFCPDDGNYVYIPSSPPQCHCRPEKPLHKLRNGSCVPHSTCKPGEGVKVKGDQFHDTICELCGPFYESNINSATEPCRLKLSVFLHPKNRHLGIGTENSTATESSAIMTTAVQSTASSHLDKANFSDRSISTAAAQDSTTKGVVEYETYPDLLTRMQSLKYFSRTRFFDVTTSSSFKMPPKTTINDIFKPAEETESKPNLQKDETFSKQIETPQLLLISIQSALIVFILVMTICAFITIMRRYINLAKILQFLGRKESNSEVPPTPTEEETSSVASCSSNGAEIAAPTTSTSNHEAMESNRNEATYINNNGIIIYTRNVETSDQPSIDETTHQDAFNSEKRGRNNCQINNRIVLYIPEANETALFDIDAIKESELDDLPNDLISLIHYFDKKSKTCDIELQYDEVDRFCRERNLALPTESERKNPPACCMSTAIKRAVKEEKTSFEDVISYFRKLKLKTIVEQLENISDIKS